MIAALALAACTVEPAGDDGDDGDELPTAEVTARAETTGSSGDPDDPAIWIDPDDPSRSLVIGTDKSRGLFVHDLRGAPVQELLDGEMNSVDVDGDLVIAGDRSDDTVAFWRIDPATRTLTALGEIDAGLTIYGSCAGAGWLFVDDKDGQVIQYALAALGDAIEVAEVRRVDVGGQVENCVIDAALGWVYVGEEDVGVWRLPLAPDGGDQPVLIAAAGSGELVIDVEGLALYEGIGGMGWLVVSSQGDNAYALYDRNPPHAYGGRFRIVAGELDAASETDGIAVTSTPLPGFPGGLLVAHDTANEGFTGNFKLVAWADVADAL